ncbi:MFS transporter [Streptomyces huiliensis]|uniref:MFS transporter n=1 Tax=Streptomyces huiliensis TaxID=2876027 RepID=UPI0021E03820|nr:MFS transporter [Streptomyces huiliensis]MBZ4318449.1 MFS transporter [Streptomyces huiliensis]
MLVLGFDGTILNVALPTMADELGADASTLQWIADSYLVVFAALMLPAGLLGDRFGRRRMLGIGLTVFLAGALVGTVATDANVVIVGRAVMGAGAALVLPLSMAVIPAIFPPEERNKAVGTMSAASALGMPLGPIIGGFLLDHFWWGSVFLINIPLIGAALIACRFLVPETNDPASPTVDALTTILSIGGLGALVYGVTEGPRYGWGSPLVLGTLAAAVVLLALLVLRSRRQERPMLDLELLRHRGFLWNSIAASLVMFTFTGLLFVLPSYFQSVLGNDAFNTGLRLIPMPLGLLTASRIAPRLVERLGRRVVIPGGLTVIAAAAFVGSRTSVEDGYGFTAGWLSVVGLGFGFAMIPAMAGALGALPRERVGTGSGLMMTLRQTAAAVGLAALGSLLAASYRDRLDTGGLSAAAAGVADDSVVSAHATAARLGDTALARSADAAYLHGMDLTLLVCGCVALLAAALVAVFLPDGHATAPATAAAPATAVAVETPDGGQ